MKQEITKTADTIEEAIELALKEAGKDESEVEITVIDEGRKNLFGKVKDPAIVKIIFEGDEDKALVAKEYLEDVLSVFGAEGASLSLTETEDSVRFDINGEGLGFLIGRRGETLDALQYLTSLVANRRSGKYMRVVINSGSFREKREETLQKLAQKIARTVLRTGRESALEPMNPYERRIIHATVSGIDGVSSKSAGEEPYRRVVITSDNPRKGGPRSFDRDKGRDNRSQRPAGSRKRDDFEKKYDKDYMPPKGVSNKPSTYDFEKEFLKGSSDDKLYSKIEIDE